MESLELTCPFCDKLLVLDAGFAGGVCRCSNCGMLMQVPASPSTKRRSTRTRPDRPDTPRSSKPSTKPVVEAQVDRDPPAPPPAVSKKRSTPNKSAKRTTKPKRQHTPTPPPSAPKPPDKKTTLTPAQTHAVERAKGKRHLAIQVSLIAAFVAIIAMSVLAITAVVRHQIRHATPKNNTPGLVVKFDYDSTANPYLMDKPNVLGIPLSPRTVVVIDASSASRKWLGLVKDAILAGSNFDTSAVTLMLVVGTEDRQAVFPESFTKLIRLPREDLRTFLNSILAFGVTDPVNAVRTALTTKPDQFVLITSQELPREHVNAIRGLLKASPSTRFDAVLIDAQAIDLLSITSLRGGQYITLSTQQITDWRYANQ